MTAVEVGWALVPASSLFLHAYTAWFPPEPRTWWWVERWNAKKAPALPPGTGGQSGGSTEWLQDLQVIPTSRTDREREHARG